MPRRRPPENSDPGLGSTPGSPSSPGPAEASAWRWPISPPTTLPGSSTGAHCRRRLATVGGTASTRHAYRSKDRHVTSPSIRLPTEIEALRLRTRRYIREVVTLAKPAPGDEMPPGPAKLSGQPPRRRVSAHPGHRRSTTSRAYLSNAGRGYSSSRQLPDRTRSPQLHGAGRGKHPPARTDRHSRAEQRHLAPIAACEIPSASE